MFILFIEELTEEESGQEQFNSKKFGGMRKVIPVLRLITEEELKEKN